MFHTLGDFMVKTVPDLMEKSLKSHGLRCCAWADHKELTSKQASWSAHVCKQGCGHCRASPESLRRPLAGDGGAPVLPAQPLTLPALGIISIRDLMLLQAVHSAQHLPRQVCISSYSTAIPKVMTGTKISTTLSKYINGPNEAIGMCRLGILTWRSTMVRTQVGPSAAIMTMSWRSFHW